MRIYNDAKKSISCLYQKPLKTLGIIVADLVFIFFYGFAVHPLLAMAVASLATLLQAIVSEEAQKTFFQAVFSNPVLKAAFYKVLLFAGLAILAIYFLYCFFQGFAWKWAKEIAKEKSDNAYIPFFFYVNLFWLFIFIFYHIITIWRDLRIEVVKTVYYNDPIWWIANLLFLLLIYFAFASYTKQGKIKKAIFTGIRNWRICIPIFLVLGFVSAIVGYGTSALFSRPLSTIVGAILLFPIFSFGRVWLWKVS